MVENFHEEILDLLAANRDGLETVTIWRGLKEKHDKDFAIGIVHAAVDQLEKQGLVFTSTQPASTDEQNAARGGRPVRLVVLTENGRSQRIQFTAARVNHRTGWCQGPVKPAMAYDAYPGISQLKR